MTPREMISVMENVENLMGLWQGLRTLKLQGEPPPPPVARVLVAGIQSEKAAQLRAGAKPKRAREATCAPTPRDGPQ